MKLEKTDAFFTARLNGYDEHMTAEISNITTQYYSRFCCTDLSKSEHGIHFVCAAERDDLLKGYGCKYALYILRKADLCVVAYSPALEDFVGKLERSDPDGILAAVERKYRLKKMRLLVFQKEKVTEYGNAKVLEGKDYPLFESFFRQTHKNADPNGWLSDYFSEKEGCFTGYFKDGRLVSVCDAPDMPYMEDRIQHTGIVTLEEERRKGYGKRTAALATHRLLQKGICPQWECDLENLASFELAKSIGYKEFGRAYILEA